jgi:hypothetical protein
MGKRNKAVVKVEVPEAKVPEVKVLTQEEIATQRARTILRNAVAFCVTHAPNGTPYRTPRYRIGVPCNLFTPAQLALWKVQENGCVIWGVGSSYAGAHTSALTCIARYNVAPETTAGEPLWGEVETVEVAS